MAAINVDKMGLKRLVALEGKIQSAIAEARTKERSVLKSKVAELALSHGFSISELFGGRGAGSRESTDYRQICQTRMTGLQIRGRLRLKSTRSLPG